MSRTIQTTLTGDSSQLRAEYAKAAKATEAYESRVQAAQALARSQSGDSLRALQLEAQGRKDAAEAVRQQMAVAEQARQLAASTGMTEQAALETVRFRVQLEQQIAQQKQAAMQASQRELQLEQQKAAAAADVARQRKAQDDANAASVRAQMEAQKARQTRIQNLPSQGWQALPGGLPALTPQSLAQMEKTNALQKQMRREMMGLGAAGSRAGLGILAVSQAVEDAQYGIRGVLNNIPQAAMAFGGSAGLAGAISLAAVAGVALYPVMARLYGIADAERLKKASEAWRQAFAEGKKAYDQKLREAELDRYLADFSESRTRSMQDQLRIQDGILRGLESQVAKRSEDKALAREIAEAEEALFRARGGFPKGTRDDGGLREDREQSAKLQEQIRDTANAELQRILEERDALTANFASERAIKDRELDDLRKRLITTEAEVARQIAGLDGLEHGTERILKGDSLRKTEKARDEINAAIARLEGERTAAAAIIASADATAKASIEQLEARANAAHMEAEGIRKQTEHQAKLNELRRQTAAAEIEKGLADYGKEFELLRARAAGDEKRVRALERQKDIEAEKLRLMKEYALGAAEALKLATQRVDLERAAAAGDEAAEKRRRKAEEAKANASERLQARRDFAGEMRALQLEANGNKEGAEALRKELAIRQEAKELAESLGVAERDALRMAREKQALEERAQQRESGGAHRRRSVIYTLSAEESAERNRRREIGLRTGGLRSTGLQSSAIEKEQRGQRLTARGRDAASSYYERSLNAQEEMVKIFKGLGVA
jgi:hypothetical protein